MLLVPWKRLIFGSPFHGFMLVGWHLEQATPRPFAFGEMLPVRNPAH